MFQFRKQAKASFDKDHAYFGVNWEYWQYITLVNILWFVSGVTMLITFFPMLLINFGDALFALVEPIGKAVTFICIKTGDALVWIWVNIIVKTALLIERAAICIWNSIIEPLRLLMIRISIWVYEKILTPIGHFLEYLVELILNAIVKSSDFILACFVSFMEILFDCIVFLV